MFGKSKDHAQYQRIIEACALKPDLAMLPAGDQTEIGEKVVIIAQWNIFCLTQNHKTKQICYMRTVQYNCTE
jgi:hypothetical protein